MELSTVIPVIRITVLFGALNRVATDLFQQWNIPAHLTGTVCLPLVFSIVLNYTLGIFHYYTQRMNQRAFKTKLPPRCPEFFPMVGNLLLFVYNQRSFMKQIAYHQGELVTARFQFLWRDLYIFQDRSSTQELAEDQSISTPTFCYTHASTRLPDHPPNLPEPTHQDVSKSHDRLHTGYKIAFTGPSLQNTITHFVDAFQSQLVVLTEPEQNWNHFKDFFGAFQDAVATSCIVTLFGIGILEQFPNVGKDVQELSGIMPSPLQDMRVQLTPRSHSSNLRRTFCMRLRAWYDICQEKPGQGYNDEHLKGDASKSHGTMRNRHTALKKAGLDDDEIIAVDVSFATALCNSVSYIASQMILHIFNDQSLLSQLKTEIGMDKGITYCGREAISGPKSPLLESILAETLRLYTNSLLIVTTPKADSSYGKWLFPRGSLGIIDTQLMHRDEKFWNTKDGLHPAHTFWAQRFLIHPQDPTSGPVRPDQLRRRRAGHGDKVEHEGHGTSVSLEHLEGSWLPFGIGKCSCPARELASRAILSTCSLMISGFDMEVLTELNGLRAMESMFPTKAGPPIAVRIRKRAHEN